MPVTMVSTIKHDAPDASRSARIGGLLVAAFAFSAVANLLMLAVPLYSLQVLGRAIPSHNLETLAFLTGVTVLALTLATLLEVFRGRILVRAGNRLELALRRSFQRDAFADRDPQRAADLSEIRGFLVRPTFAGLLDMPWAPLYGVVIWWIHPQIFALVAFGVLAVVGLGIVAHHLCERPGDAAREAASPADRIAAALAADPASGRAMRAIDPMLDRWMTATQAGNAHLSTCNDRGAIVGAATRWIRQLLLIGVTGVGALLVMEQHLSLAGMIATSMLVAKAMMPFDIVFGGWTGVVKAAGAIRRLRVPRTVPPRDTVPARQSETSGSVVAVDGAYVVPPGAQQPALRGVTFEVAPGECLAVLGANGAGKSTVARILTGALRPQGGTVRIDGRDPVQADDLSIGYLPEHPSLLAGTVAEVIGRFQADAALVAEAAAATGLEAQIAGLPHGFATDVQIAVAALGGGGLRRLLLARAICGRPRLLVLDEPLGHLDTAGAEMVRQILRTAKGMGITVVVLSQNPRLLDAADKVLVLNEGVAGAFGPTDHVISGARRDARPDAVATDASRPMKLTT
jgi:ABC-type protease/lipase transport system fused ATPase/permease subunit